MQPGFGLGLRPPHYRAILELGAGVDWLEIVSENFMAEGGPSLWHLDRIRERYPVVMHGVSLSIGGEDPLDQDYLAALERLAERCEPLWISDHLSWSNQGGTQLHDLLPLPWTAEALAHVSGRVQQVQERLKRPLVLENVSAYLGFRASEMGEAEFLRALVQRTGCELLLDLNNLHVSASNLGFDAQAYLETLPANAVRQIHLAGHEAGEHALIDTHDRAVADPVWAVYARALALFGPVATMIERDDAIPPLPELLGELGRARALAAEHAHRAARVAA
ncbi:DUF692 domain-containing protein [Niveibacterium sp. SC-1]|uniref:MNIO family bufferin maturase n=1 Tax=Niveibacterium sp. SC-1 TaxID=3135646 RepID=UPI00311FA58F